MRLCGNCKKRPTKKHFNSKWCVRCANKFRKAPRSTLSKSDIRKVNSWIGKIPVKEIAERLDTSVSNVKRAFVGKSIWFHNGKYKNQPKLVEQVFRYYEKHGKVETAKKFPGVRVRSIVERPNYYGITFNSRQTRWTDDQLIELAKMAGVISLTAQAKWFNRPGANKGSIVSVWNKRFSFCSGSINGMARCQAKHFVSKRCPMIKTKFWRSRRQDRERDGRILYLWVDMEKHLLPECPDFVKQAIKTMAEFQRWMFSVKDVRGKILRMIESREI